ncbi:MAG: response regulator [Thermoflexales bacterium]|nr:response regulator [Thermoflexales bacterium]
MKRETRMDNARILIVEDEQIVARDLEKRLTALGYSVSAVAASGKGAIQKAAETQPDLVLMDITLRGEMDGVEAAGLIQERFDLPVVYLTAHADETTLQRAKLTGPLGYILKPFQERDLYIGIEIALYKHRLERELRLLNQELECRVAERTAQLEEANRELRAEFARQKRMQARLMHADRLSALGQLAASVAHEINNPLQSVIGCLALAQEALVEEGEDAGEYLKVAREEVRRIARIVARMRDLYRPESGKRELTDLNALVEHVLDLSRKRCQESRIILEWRPAESLPSLELASDQIKQVLLNLMLNAIDAMPGGGCLEVSTVHTPDPPGVRVVFRDNGVGIPPEVLPHIFETFYSTKPEGSGLGLAISLNIVSEHNGRLDVQSQVGEGSTFTAWLPAA